MDSVQTQTFMKDSIDSIQRVNESFDPFQQILGKEE